MSRAVLLLLCAACSTPHGRETVPTDRSEPRPEDAPAASVGECTTPSECTLCAFAEPFVTEADCACWGCAHVPMSSARCEAIAASHREVCGAWMQTHACPSDRECDTMSIPSCAAGRCGETRVHLQ